MKNFFLDPKYDDMHIKIQWNVQPMESAHKIFLTSNAELEKNQNESSNDYLIF